MLFYKIQQREWNAFIFEKKHMYVSLIYFLI